MLIAKHTLRLINFTFVVGLTKLFSQILDPIDLLLRFFFGFKKVKILLKWLYLSLFQLGLRLGCAHFYFKPQNRKNKIKNIIIKNFFFGFNSGGSFEPPGLQVEPPQDTFSVHHRISLIPENPALNKEILQVLHLKPLHQILH